MEFGSSSSESSFYAIFDHLAYCLDLCCIHMSLYASPMLGLPLNKEIGCRLLEKDPYHLTCMPLHIGAALELGRKNELFLRAHNLVQEYPNK